MEKLAGAAASNFGLVILFGIIFVLVLFGTGHSVLTSFINRNKPAAKRCRDCQKVFEKELWDNEN